MTNVPPPVAWLRLSSCKYYFAVHCGRHLLGHLNALLWPRDPLSGAQPVEGRHGETDSQPFYIWNGDLIVIYIRMNGKLTSGCKTSGDTLQTDSYHIKCHLTHLSNKIADGKKYFFIFIYILTAKTFSLFKLIWIDWNPNLVLHKVHTR